MTENIITIAPYAFLIALLVACGIAVVSLSSIKKLHLRLKECEIELATAKAVVSGAEDQLHEYQIIRSSHEELVADRSKAVAERDETLKQLDAMRRDRDIAVKSKERADFLAGEAERRAQLAQQELSGFKERMKDWEHQKEHSVEAARAAIMKAGGDMSSKLLEDHKRETEHTHRQGEERVRKTTEQLLQKFEIIAKSVHTLQSTTLDTRSQMDTVMRSLSNPAGAGQMAEIGLENSLKDLGLSKGRDFIMQYSTTNADGKTLRPDAVIFLPQDTVMVVDCKASKALIELAKAQTPEEETRAMHNLRKTMNEHLRALASKDYRAAVLQSFKDAGKSENVGHIFNVMYLPSESAIERVREVDARFDEKLSKHNIILAGPSSLSGLFSLAKMNIAAAKQVENEKLIVELVEDLMESTITAYEHVGKVGKGIHSAMTHFEGFAKSVNSRLLPRMRALKEAGVSPKKNRDIPQPLPIYDVRRVEQTVVIQAETERRSVESSQDNHLHTPDDEKVKSLQHKRREMAGA